MIDINLVPPHLRRKQKGGRFLLGKINIPLEVIVGCGGGLLVLLGAIHVLLLFVNVKKLAQHKILQSQWEDMRPDKDKVDSVISNLRTVQGKYKAVTDIAKKGELSWAHKLNLLSDSLPRGMWLKKIALNDETLLIEGSAISRDANEIISVHRLTSSLKENEEFMKDFMKLELGSIQRRKIKKVEIADFVITMKLK